MTVPAMSTIDGLKGINMIDVARNNGMQIISCTLTIEAMMKKIIISTLFAEVKEKKELVIGLVLDAEWFSFAVCKNLFLKLIHTERIVSGNDRAELEKDLSNIMRCRNAFAHGSITYDGTNIHLKYFEGLLKQVELDEKYWTEKEELYLRAFNKLVEIEKTVDSKNEGQTRK